MKILVTGDAGFRGSAVTRHIISNTTDTVVNVAKLTITGSLQSLAQISPSSRYEFEQVDISDQLQINCVLIEPQLEAMLHLATELRVNGSISGPFELEHYSQSNAEFSHNSVIN